MEQLRHYQVKAVGLLREKISERPICVLPTGAGKTHVAAEIIRLAAERGRRVLMVAHRRELILQARDRLALFGVKAGVILPDLPRTEAAVQVGSIQTLVRRDFVPADLLIIDECHHAVSDTYTKLLARYPDANLIGLTATPARLDGQGLGRVFGCLVEPVTVDELVGSGFLVAPTVYTLPTVDLTGIRKSHGDYGDMLKLGERMAKLTGDVVEHYKRHAHCWPTVAFACNVTHSIHVAGRLCAAGYRFVHLDASSAKGNRAEALRDLQAGRIHGVVNCDLFGEGVDVPALRCAIIVRPTLSLTIHRQQIGRIMRPPGPCVVLDHAGNYIRHGLVTDHVTWSLDDKPKAVPGSKPCPQCYRAIPVRAVVCPECGYVFPQPDPEETEPKDPIPETVEGTLAPVNLVGVQAEDPRAVYIDLVRVAFERKYKIGWARYQYKHKFGAWPKFYKIEQEEYPCEHEWSPAGWNENFGWQEECSRCGRRSSSRSAQ